VDSILATYSLLGPVIAVLRPVAAFVSGIVGGAVVELVEKDDSRPAGAATTCDGACWRHAEGGALVRMARYAFYTLPGDIGRPLLVGLAVAGLIGAAVPESFFAEYLGGGSVGRDLVAMLVMLIIGLPVYVCATASIPVAAALMAKGVSPGAALVFLMTGPATNAATIATVWKTMGRRTTAAYLATVAACAFGAGLVLNRIDPKVPLGSVHEHAMSGDWLGTVFAIVLLAVLAVALAGPRLARRRAAALDGEGAMTTLAIEGMTCSHCAASVRAALLACKGVEEAEVDLGRGVAVVKGEAADPAEMRGRIEGLGYKVKDTCAGR